VKASQSRFTVNLILFFMTIFVSTSFAEGGRLPTYRELEAQIEQEILRPEAKRLKVMLLKNCFACHVQVKEAPEMFRSRFGDFMKAGVLNKYNGAGNVNSSSLYRLVASGQMPDAYIGKIPQEEREEILSAISDWIGKGSPSLEATVAAPAKDPSYALKFIEADLRKQVSPKDVRYISLVHLFDNPATQNQVLSHRQAVAKVCNSVSWGPALSAPVALDKEGLVLRIKLSDYNWSQTKWKELERLYPYSLDHWNVGGAARGMISEISASTGSRTPILRGDWLINQLTTSQTYAYFLDLPSTDGALEKLLKINVVQNLKSNTAVRGGLFTSGISRNNRVIERHEIPEGGYYWKTYDFENEVGRRNLQEFPMDFEKQSSEILFSLPNGLQAYMIVNQYGQRIDSEPVSVVSDIEQPNRSVTNGVSCMRCHDRGLIAKEDQIGTKENLSQFDEKQRLQIKGLYRPAELQKAFASDSAKFQRALSKLAIGPIEPVRVVTALYNDLVHRDQILSELGISENKLKEISTVASSNVDLTLVDQLVNRASAGGLKRKTVELASYPAQLAIITKFLQLSPPQNQPPQGLTPIRPLDVPQYQAKHQAPRSQIVYWRDDQCIDLTNVTRPQLLSQDTCRVQIGVTHQVMDGGRCGEFTRSERPALLREISCR
jgi:hypothetical protein